LGDELLKAEAQHISTRWTYDQHFNETGNAMFADAMYRWMIHRNDSSQQRASYNLSQTRDSVEEAQ
jgi:hypothetical protein